jgi:hypothetical protein
MEARIRPVKLWTLNGAQRSPNGPKCSLNGAKRSLNGATRSLNGPKRSPRHQFPTIPDACAPQPRILALGAPAILRVSTKPIPHTASTPPAEVVTTTLPN